jgi:hypothetical protein
MDTTKEPTDTTPTDAPATATTPEDRIATLEREIAELKDARRAPWPRQGRVQ